MQRQFLDGECSQEPQIQPGFPKSAISHGDERLNRRMRSKGLRPFLFPQKPYGYRGHIRTQCSSGLTLMHGFLRPHSVLWARYFHIKDSTYPEVHTFYQEYPSEAILTNSLLHPPENWYCVSPVLETLLPHLAFFWLTRKSDSAEPDHFPFNLNDLL